MDSSNTIILSERDIRDYVKKRKISGSTCSGYWAPSKINTSKMLINSLK
ncbi:hypothetical protein QUF74_09660 [Candidatus Halobeggiatoa sp. HSG11]|nr:hypothetical protein [Candidatus Halobeggiatoa sp. HSG11]